MALPNPGMTIDRERTALLVTDRHTGVWNISQRNRDASVTRRAVDTSDEFRLEAYVW